MVVALVFLLAAGQAPAQASAAPAAPVKEKKICRSETSTGSIMPKRTCHTQAEWQKLSGSTAELNSLRTDQQTGRMVQGAHNQQ